MTLQNIIKTIAIFVVAVFAFAQSTPLIHAHSHTESDPAPCVICITSTYNNNDFDLPPPETISGFTAFIALSLPKLTELHPKFFFSFIDKKPAPPPDIRPSAPRAPPLR